MAEEKTINPFATEISNLYKQAGLAYTQGNLDEALRLLNKALTYDPKNSSVLSFKSRLESPLTPDERLKMLNFHNEAMDAFASEDFTKAIDWWKKALAIRPTDTRIQNLISRAQKMLAEKNKKTAQKEISNTFVGSK